MYSEGMTHSFFELFLHFDQKWSTTLACLFFREIGFSESLIFWAKIKKIQGASKPTGWKFVNLAHFGGNWITKLANFRPKILFFLAIFILTKITFFVDGHRLMTYWFFLSSTYFLSEKYNFDLIKVIWGTLWGTWKFQINKEMSISWKECVIPKAPYSDFD